MKSVLLRMRHPNNLPLNHLRKRRKTRCFGALFTLSLVDAYTVVYGLSASLLFIMLRLIRQKYACLFYSILGSHTLQPPPPHHYNHIVLH